MRPCASLTPVMIVMSAVAIATSAHAAPNSTMRPQLSHSTSAEGEAAKRQGLLQLQSHDLDAAVASFTLAISQTPTPDAFKYRARAYAAQGRLGLALADTNSGLRLAPSNRDLRKQRTQLAAMLTPAPGQSTAPSLQRPSDSSASAANMANGVRTNLEAALRAGPRFNVSGAYSAFGSGGVYDGAGREDPLASAIQSRVDAAVQARLAELGFLN